MDLIEAIYARRAVRTYQPDVVDQDTVRKLLRAAVQAPSAMNAQPWGFVILQDRAKLAMYSERAKALMLARTAHDPKAEHYRRLLSDPGFNIFYDASTLIAICADPTNPYSQADCWLAAQNLQLAALAFGLGSCCIGFALPLLNEREVKAELAVPDRMAVIAALIVGKPRGPAAPVARAEPVVLSWQR